MSTESAQRRLLEAIAGLHSTPGGVQAFRAGLQDGVELSDGLGSTHLSAVYRALDDLASAVHADLTREA